MTRPKNFDDPEKVAALARTYARMFREAVTGEIRPKPDTNDTGDKNNDSE
jgi:hypothetical protein